MQLKLGAEQEKALLDTAKTALKKELDLLDEDEWLWQNGSLERATKAWAGARGR